MAETFEKETAVQNQTRLSSPFIINKKTVLLLLIAVLAVVSRLYILGERVMSHDEINHVYFAYNFFKGGEYVHNPITHGPLQFHLLELSYFLFGASDFTARIPAAFFSVLTIIFIWRFKRYLGETGAIAASVLYLISPYMLYYGRYARNEAIAIFFTVATLWAVLRFLDNGDKKYLYLTAAFTALHFATKETAFIFTAELMVFLGLLFIYRISKLDWRSEQFKRIFLILLLITAVILIGALAANRFVAPEAVPLDPAETVEPVPAPDAEPGPVSSLAPVVLYLVIAAGVAFAAAFVFLVIGYGWPALVQERAFGMLLFQLALVLPQLVAFPAFWLKIPMMEYTNTEAIQQVSLIMVPFLLISLILGALWKPKEWLVAAGIYYGIFILFYTSIFSNLGGIYSGLIGSLGYWLEQHGVERGSQPWYYFMLIQLPIYEYLAVIGTFITGVYGLIWTGKKLTAEDRTTLLMEDPESGELSVSNSRRIALAMLVFISAVSLIAYAVVGEKMPWLTVHISWSMWLVTGWLIGRLIDRFEWHAFWRSKRFAAIAAALVAFIAFFRALALLVAPIQPFSGKELAQLEATGEFLLVVLLFAGAIFAFLKFTSAWKAIKRGKIVLLTFLLLLGGLTVRHAAMASYKYYDQANEYLVYAHAARGPKDAMEQIESISLRVTGGKEIMVAYDNHASYPYWWYLREYPNRFEFFENPTRELRNYPIILAGDSNYHLLDPIVQDDYIQFEYLRMIWPNQDYFDLSFYTNYLSNPETRSPMLNALLQVWLNRDFQAYGEVTGQNTSARHWNPSQSFKMYVRNDIAAQVWQFGALASAVEVQPDPYTGGKLELSPLYTLNDLGLNGPKGLATAPDGSVYVADTGNNRIIQITAEDGLINQWGSEGVGPGEFNQPWGVAVDQDGNVFVTDTWNHRIQKFSPSGEFLNAWGTYGQAETPTQFWGPRGITVDQQGNVLVTDTGNKRVVIFTAEGEFVDEFGSVGYLQGQFDEPVGIAASPVDDRLYVADTWNQRVQVFEYADDAGYLPINEWEIDGWYGQSLDNKPFLAADNLNRVIVADPEAARVLVFANDGTFLNTFGDYNEFSAGGFGLVGGVAADDLGGVWVADSLKNELKYFVLP